MIEEIKQFDELVQSLEHIENKSDLTQITYKMSYFFEQKDDIFFQELPKRSNIYFDSIYKICQNFNFNESLCRVMGDADVGKTLKDDYEFIYLSLRAAVFPLLFFIPHLRPDTIIYLHEKIQKDFSSLKLYQRERGIVSTAGDIRKKLLAIITDESCEYREDYRGPYMNLALFFQNIHLARLLITNILYTHQTGENLRLSFKKLMQAKKEKGDRFSLSMALYEIYKAASSVSFFNSSVPETHSTIFKDFFDKFQQNKNEKNAAYIISKMAEGFGYREDGKHVESFKEKIFSSTEIKKEIEIYARSNLMAYSGVIPEGSIEWSNKIYLISIKTLSVLEELKEAQDERWVVSVIFYEYYHWLDEIHNVLNRYDIEDDWNQIEELVTQENSQVEWKSTFYTPTEQKFINDENEKKASFFILTFIIDAILGMINTGGGIILVGLIESPDRIIREDVKRNLLVKNGITFFDIHYEFQKKNKNLDSTKREIQDKLFSETHYSADKFNDLFSIEPLEIKGDNKVVTIYKILIKKSETYIFNAKKEGDRYWISLTKRADGRTIRVDPRNYISGKNNA